MPLLVTIANLSARGASVLGRVVAGEHLHLLDGVHVGSGNNLAVAAGAGSHGAVDGVLGVILPRAVDLERIAAVEGEVKVTHRGVTDNARQHLRHIDRVAPVQLLFLNLGSGHFALNGRRLRLQDIGSVRYL